MKLQNNLIGILAALFSLAVQGQSMNVVCKNGNGDLSAFEVHRQSGQLELSIRDRLMLRAISRQLHDPSAASRKSYAMNSVDELCVPSEKMESTTVFECVFHRYGHFELVGTEPSNLIQGGIFGDIHPADIVMTPTRITVRKIENDSAYRVSLAMVLNHKNSGPAGVYLERIFGKSECNLEN